MHLSLFSAEAPYTLLLMAAAALLIFRPLTRLRRSLSNTAVFYAACLLGDLLAGFGGGEVSAARWLRELAVFGEGLAVVRYLALALFQVILPRLRVHISGILADILVIVGYILWFLIRLSTAGVELTALFTTSAVITAVVAFSMQETLGNLLGGLALQMDNSLEIGDWIRIDDVSGQVTDIQWRYTAIQTRAGERVVVPNSHLMKNRYVVVCDKRAASAHQRRNIAFNVDLSVAPARVISAVLQDLQTARIPNVSLQPLPQCLLIDFGSGFAHFVLRYWLIDPGPDEPTDSEVRRHVLAALQRDGIRLAVSDQSIHLVQEGKAHRADVHARELERRRQAIARIDLFARLSEAEQLELARRLVNSPFASGDVLFRQGAVAHWLYIIIAGTAEAWWQPEGGGEPRLLEQRGPGSVFGELGLMTGAPRRATVIATSDITAYRLDKTSFEQIIRARPEIAEGISAILEKRHSHFSALESGYAGDKTGTHSSHGSEVAALGKKIREFFGL